MYELQVNKYKTKVFLCDDGNWRHDTVFIYNDSKCIAEKEIETIIEYLFNEGFIKDRRTKYYIAEKNSDK
tara:strand:+ start:2027 stop:2236 length:210 start_codon:yes stop_codon:yes gene_type:complete